MKRKLSTKIKVFLWDKLKQATGNISTLEVHDLKNGYIRCSWSISDLDQAKIKLSRIYFFAIRFFDITNSNSTNFGTCIMKEIQVNKHNEYANLQIPLNSGIYMIEIGYRKRNGEWRGLASKKINLGFSSKLNFNLDEEDWFDASIYDRKEKDNVHEEIYQLSLSDQLGGSEKISSRTNQSGLN